MVLNFTVFFVKHFFLVLNNDIQVGNLEGFQRKRFQKYVKDGLYLKPCIYIWDFRILFKTSMNRALYYGLFSAPFLLKARPWVIVSRLAHMLLN